MSYERLLEKLRKHSPRANATMDQVRLDFEDFYSSFQANCRADVEKIHLKKDIPAFWIRHPDIKTQNVILFLHGGGFTIGSTKDHLGLCSRLSHSTQARIFSVDYRLAPEHRFPAALNDCLLAYETLLTKYDPAQIMIAGISAGGNLLLSMLQVMTQKAIPMPSAAIAMSPAVDLLFKGESIKRNENNDWIFPERLANLRENYLGATNPKDPLVSPIFGDLTGFPPLLIQVGTHELLLDDIRLFVSKLKSQNGTVQFEEWEGMFHCWQVFASEVFEGQQAIRAIGEFTREIWNQ